MIRVFSQYTNSMASEHNDKRTAAVIKGIIIALAVVLGVLLIFLIWQSIAIHREKIISARELWITNIFKHHGAPTASDVVFIRPWMTFDYVDTLFHIPSSYLETQLPVNDARYPKITIGGYAKEENVNQATFTSDVQAAVAHYLMMATSTATTTAASSTK